MSYHLQSDLNRKRAHLFRERNGAGHQTQSVTRLDHLIRDGGPDGQMQRGPGKAVAASAQAREKSEAETKNPDGVAARKRDDTA